MTSEQALKFRTGVWGSTRGFQLPPLTGAGICPPYPLLGAVHLQEPRAQGQAEALRRLPGARRRRVEIARVLEIGPASGARGATWGGEAERGSPPR